MTDTNLHIVSFDVPWPADYGGVVDVFYKIKALHQLGVKVHLHCFTQGRTEQDELNKYCATVNYYQRMKNISRLSFHIPFIVNSRVSDELINNLQKDNYPILLEGIHTSYYLYKGKLTGRKVLLRLANTEFEYYKQLGRRESNILKKIYFLLESSLLKKYEKRIAATACILAISQQDVEMYKQYYQAKDIHYLAAFIPWCMSVGKEGKGCFCLYHGNLSINENEAAVLWLLDNVFTDTETAFVIAGKSPSKKLIQKAKEHAHTCLVADPSDKELQDLIAKAHINILPSFNNTGVKLKLLNALCNGRHCLVNAAGVKGSGLETYCHVAADADSFRDKINELYQLPFTEQEMQNRQGFLQEAFNNEFNAKKLMQYLQ